MNRSLKTATAQRLRTAHKPVPVDRVAHGYAASSGQRTRMQRTHTAHTPAHAAAHAQLTHLRQVPCARCRTLANAGMKARTQSDPGSPVYNATALPSSERSAPCMQRRLCCGVHDFLLAWLASAGAVGRPANSIRGGAVPPCELEGAALKPAGGHGEREHASACEPRPRPASMRHIAPTPSMRPETLSSPPMCAHESSACRTHCSRLDHARITALHLVVG